MTSDILVIDDEPVITHAVAKICGGEGLSVEAAEHGAAGLALLERRAYRLILCDLMMSGVDGFAFLAEALRRGVTAPVIMTTGYATLENAVHSLKRGAADFIPKPFTADELLAVVRRGLRLSDLRARAAPPSLLFVPCPPKYHRLGHLSWVAVEDSGTALIGAADLFMKSLDGVRSIELKPAGGETAQAEACAWLLGADGSRHALLAPLGGRVVEANAVAAERPVLVEKDPYFEGWLYRVAPSALGLELANLVSCSSDRS